MMSLYCDGACEPKNPGGIATYGWIAKRDQIVLARSYGFVVEGAQATNNRAEYSAVLRALEWILREGIQDRPVHILLDSQLVIRQLQGQYQVRSEHVLLLWLQVRKRLTDVRRYTLTWIPREENKEADALCQEAYRRHLLLHGKTCVAYNFQH